MLAIMNSIVITSLLLFPWIASAQNYWLVTPATIPGWNPANTADVLRYEFKKTDPLVPLSSIPWTLTNDPVYAAFSSQGELFVSNRHGNVLGGAGSISRFLFDAKGNFVSNGTIQGNSLEAVHGLAFFPTGELFSANLRNGLISRFLFSAGGNAIANGTIATGEFINLGLAVSPRGELFSTHDSSMIRRWVFNSDTGAAIPNGSISVSGATRLHGLAFDSDGELFIADLGTDRIFRFNFDNSGTAVSNGNIPVSGGPAGVALSSRGELFVTSAFSGVISRFLFDSNGNYVSNGSIATPGTLGGVAVFTQQSARGKRR